MKNNCIFIPTIKKNNIEQSSKLFVDLLNTLSNNRDVAVPAYDAALSISSFLDENEIDEFGEPKIDAVIKYFDLFTKNINDFSKKGIEKELKIKNESNNNVFYKSFESAYEKIQYLNKNSTNNIGIVKYSKDGYYIEIDKLSNENSKIIDTQKLVYELNPKFKRILNDFGFDVQRIENLEDNGIFSPENAEKNANGLIDIIKLAKGINGDYAFTEEFCHFIIAGLKNNVFVQRLFNLVNDDVAKDILGEEYEMYKSKYKEKNIDNNELNNLLREEAIGKLLAESLSNKNNELTNQTLFKRFEKSLMNFLKGKDEKKIQEIIDEAKNALSNITNKIFDVDEEFFKNFSKNDVLNAKNLLQIKKKVSTTLEKISHRILEINAKEKQLSLIKTPTTDAKDRRIYIEEKNEKLRKSQEYYNAEKHKENCFLFVSEISEEYNSLITKLDNIKNEIKNNKYDDTIRIGKLCYCLNSIKNYSSAYREVVTNLLLLKDSSFSKEEKETLDNACKELLSTISKLEKSYKEARFDVIRYWLETYYWKKDIKYKNEKGEDVIITLESLLREAPKDINFVDLYISEMGHCSDIMLNLLSTITKKQLARRDQKLEEIDLKIKKIHKDFNDNTDFMYERNSNGIPTGRLISNIDFDKYENEYNNFKKELEKSDLSEKEKHEKIVNWYKENTESVVVDKTNNRKERLPNAKYKTNSLNKLSFKQRQYYNEMIQLKAEMETLIGPTNYHVYNAPQISSDYIQKFSDKNVSLKDKINFIFSDFKGNFFREVDDTEFGEIDENGVKKVVLDMNGRPIKKIPVYFVNKLKDMNKLNTDFSKGISAYCAMAVNYNEMSKIVNQIETFRDLILDRDVKQMSGGTQLANLINVGQTIIKEEYKEKGGNSNIGERIDKYIDMVFYGMMKNDEGSVKIGEKKFDVAKNIDNVKKYEGLLGLGFNPFSGFSNISMGEIQMVIEAMANSGMSLIGGEKDTFGIKDWLFGHKEYIKELPKIITEAESMTKTSKVGLLMRKFDTEQTFFEDLKNSGYYSNFGKRWLGNNSLSYIMQNMGEHYLHTILMIAMLKSKKVLLNGKEVSLYDAYEVKDNKIVERGEIKELDGKKFTNDKFIDFKLKIQDLSHQFNGAFSAEDLGTLNQKSIGRLILQFRQWMPGHYSRRFASKYYNTATKQFSEGYWITTFKFIKEVCLSLIKHKRSIPEYWKGLSNYEKTNLMKTLSEILILLSISMLIRGIAFGEDDDDDDDEKSRLAQFLKYQVYRTHLEIVATMPITPSQMMQNTLTMLQSPMAAINGIESAWNLIRLDHLFNEIETGSYKGMSVYHRDLLKAIPYYGQLRKLYDLATEEYMFNLFKK